MDRASRWGCGVLKIRVLINRNALSKHVCCISPPIWPQPQVLGITNYSHW